MEISETYDSLKLSETILDCKKRESTSILEKELLNRLLITVREIKGHCPVYRIGDKIVLEEGYRFNLEESDNVCMHSLSSIMPYYNAIYRGVAPSQLGLARDGQKAYVQCLDPCDYTGGGTVLFEIERVVG